MLALERSNKDDMRSADSMIADRDAAPAPCIAMTEEGKGGAYAYEGYK